MTTAFIVEARMNSKRLPGKIFLKVNKKPIIQHLIERLKKIEKVSKIIIATTRNHKDDIIVNFAKRLKVDFYRGSEKKVTKRVFYASKKFKIKTIISITSDCPLIDISIINRCIKLFKKKNVDFLTNAHFRSYPDGMDVQIFKHNALKKALDLAVTKKDFEHTTYVLRKNPKLFKTFHVFAPKKLYYPNLGLTLDELDDFKFIKKIILSFDENYIFSCEDIINLLKKRKKLFKINSKVKRNSYLIEEGVN